MKNRNLKWEGTIGGDPNNPFPLEKEKPMKNIQEAIGVVLVMFMIFLSGFGSMMRPQAAIVCTIVSIVAVFVVTKYKAEIINSLKE